MALDSKVLVSNIEATTTANSCTVKKSGSGPMDFLQEFREAEASRVRYWFSENITQMHILRVLYNIALVYAVCKYYTI